MTRLMLIEDRPGLSDGFRAEGLLLVPAHEDRAGMALVRFATSGVLTVDLALPGYAGYRCVTALGGGASEVPILALVGCDEPLRGSSMQRSALLDWSVNQNSAYAEFTSRVRSFVQRNRALRLAHLAGWPSTLGLPSREFDRLLTVVRRCGRVTTQPERQYTLTVRTFGFLVVAGTTVTETGAYADAWHAMQFAIARDTTLEHRAIA